MQELVQVEVLLEYQVEASQVIMTKVIQVQYCYFCSSLGAFFYNFYPGGFWTSLLHLQEGTKQLHTCFIFFSFVISEY